MGWHPRSRRLLPVAGIAVAGVVLGHWLAYRLAVPQAHMRAEVLHASGHGYLILAVKAAVVLGLSAVGSLLLVRSGAAKRGEPLPVAPLSSLVLRLSVVQIVAFSAMEVTERVAAGAPLSGLLGHHVFLFGLALQFLAAFVGALVLLWVGRAADAIGRALRSLDLPRPATVGEHPHPIFLPVAAGLAGAAGVRGPPSS
jgi:hypothetical protein